MELDARFCRYPRWTASVLVGWESNRSPEPVVYIMEPGGGRDNVRLSLGGSTYMVSVVGAAVRSDKAVAVIGGMVTSTLLTLVVVPVAYSLLDAASERVMGRRKILHTIDEATAPVEEHHP